MQEGRLVAPGSVDELALTVPNFSGSTPSSPVGLSLQNFPQSSAPAWHDRPADNSPCCPSAFRRLLPDSPPDYAGRVAALIEQRIALWNVLAAASRSGSLDAAIEDDAIPNNFRAFFHSHPGIGLIAFNGATAAKLYERHVMPTLEPTQQAVTRRTLPSTSGAHAGLTFAEKTAR